jgi:hypothetical protein
MDAVQREAAQGGIHDDDLKGTRNRYTPLPKEEYCPLFFREPSGHRRGVSHEIQNITHCISMSYLY